MVGDGGKESRWLAQPLIRTKENSYFYKFPVVELGGIEPPSISP